MMIQEAGEKKEAEKYLIVRKSPRSGCSVRINEKAVEQFLNLEGWLVSNYISDPGKGL